MVVEVAASASIAAEAAEVEVAPSVLEVLGNADTA